MSIITLLDDILDKQSKGLSEAEARRLEKLFGEIEDLYLDKERSLPGRGEEIDIFTFDSKGKVVRTEGEDFAVTKWPVVLKVKKGVPKILLMLYIKKFLTQLQNRVMEVMSNGDLKELIEEFRCMELHEEASGEIPDEDEPEIDPIDALKRLFVNLDESIIH